MDWTINVMSEYHKKFFQPLVYDKALKQMIELYMMIELRIFIRDDTFSSNSFNFDCFLVLLLQSSQLRGSESCCFVLRKSFHCMRNSFTIECVLEKMIFMRQSSVCI